MKRILIFLSLLALTSSIFAREFHISKKGNDANNGTKVSPFLTIQKAADIAVPGDVITVHEGVYRERIDPNEGGKTKHLRIVYQAAKGEKVVIKGSELISNWKSYGKNVWTAEVPNTLFKGFNPYAQLMEADWFIKTGINHHLGEVFVNGKSLFEQNSLAEVIHPKACPWAVDSASSLYVWYAEVKAEKTIFWVNFQTLNPNKEVVEISARKACFYPSHTGCNYITVNGFEMTQAATNWAPPTSEQEGLIGTNWSKGWLIENNRISNSKCCGISLGKDRASGQDMVVKNPLKTGDALYNEVVFNAVYEGWSKETIGSHVVRNNVIFDCGQAGVIGSLGCAFSQIYNNHIYNIYTKRNSTGMEMAGIKLHGSIDVLIKDNLIHNCHCGVWLDWMAQGARVTRNIFYHNDQYDFHNEVNHGPLMLDHNLFLSKEGISTLGKSEATSYVHNLLAGRTKNYPILGRCTPYFLAHSTRIKGVTKIEGGDNRYYNNIYVGVEGIPDVSKNRQIKNNHDIDCGLRGLDKMKYKSIADGNVFYIGATPYKDEINSVHVTNFKPTVALTELENGVIVKLIFDASIQKAKTQLVTTKRLGKTIITEADFEQADGSPYLFDTDFYGNKRNETHPLPGPFENLKPGVNIFRFIHQ